MKPKMYANIHTHSTHSDGEYTPYEIAKIAKEEGYGAIALADHDTVTGNGEMKEACAALGMETIYGCEFFAHSYEDNYTFHLTGYDFDPTMPEMKEYLTHSSINMSNRTKGCFEIAKSEGLIPKQIEWQDVLSDEQNKGITWLTNDHVFRTMKKMGLAVDTDYPPFLQSFLKHWNDVPDTYEKLTIDKVIALVKKAGGIAILAHPNGYLHRIPAFIEMGLDGIEVWHPNLTEDEVVEALKIAMDNNLYISGGSDHHGLCGGQYKFYEDPTESRYYIEPCTQGTTKEFFEEMKTRKLNPDRKAIISEYIKSYDK